MLTLSVHINVNVNVINTRRWRTKKKQIALSVKDWSHSGGEKKRSEQ